MLSESGPRISTLSSVLSVHLLLSFKRRTCTYVQRHTQHNSENRVQVKSLIKIKTSLYMCTRSVAVVIAAYPPSSHSPVD